MKKLMMTTVIVLGLIGSSSAQLRGEDADIRWDSVIPDEPQIGQDVELQAKAQESLQKIVDASQEFAICALKKIAEQLDEQDKQKLKELIARFRVLLEKYVPAIERGDFDALDDDAQAECEMLLEELGGIVITPLILMLDQSGFYLSSKSALMTAFRKILLTSMHAIITQLQNELK